MDNYCITSTRPCQRIFSIFSGFHPRFFYVFLQYPQKPGLQTETGFSFSAYFLHCTAALFIGSPVLQPGYHRSFSHNLHPGNRASVQSPDFPETHPMFPDLPAASEHPEDSQTTSDISVGYQTTEDPISTVRSLPHTYQTLSASHSDSQGLRR